MIPKVQRMFREWLESSPGNSENAFSNSVTAINRSWIVLAMVGFGIILLSLIAYEIISKKREMEERDAQYSGLKRGPSRKRKRIKKIRVKEKKLRPRERRVLLPGDSLLPEDIDSPFANHPFMHQDPAFDGSHDKLFLYD
ncbi:hypothetical protein ScPMuIL_013227 [Solemya velum]